MSDMGDGVRGVVLTTWVSTVVPSSPWPATAPRVEISAEARAALEASHRIVAGHAVAADPVYGVSTGIRVARHHCDPARAA